MRWVVRLVGMEVVLLLLSVVGASVGLSEEQLDRMMAQTTDYRENTSKEVARILQEEDVGGVVVVQPLRHIGLPKKGSYVVKEEIQKPPLHDHPCNLTLTAIKIAFPEMESEVFINLLGYKEPNLVHLMRCKVGTPAPPPPRASVRPMGAP